MKTLLTIICSIILAFTYCSCKKQSITCVCEDYGRGGVEIFRADLNTASDCTNKQLKYNALSMYGEVECHIER